MAWMFLLLFACELTVEEGDDSGGGGEHDSDDSDGPVDRDADGFAEAEDCNDTDPSVNPGADEICDSVDNDCDGDVDVDATDAGVFYADVDGDGQGDPSAALASCTKPDGYATTSDDCDDTNDAVFSGAQEVCNGVDDDCDLAVDEEASDVVTFFADVDDDGFGDANSSTNDCEAPSGYVADATDCDDADELAFPGADERCNNADDDCDSEVDEDPVDPTVFYADTDVDLFGDPDISQASCVPPRGWVSIAGDCNDADGDVFPGAAERCDGVDNDCDPSTTEDGLAGFTQRSGGTFTDLTDVFAAGTPSNPAFFDDGSRSGTLRFCPGTYYVTLDMGGGELVIEGMGAGPGDVVLDGGGTARVVKRLHQSQVFDVRNLTIQNGFVAGEGGGFWLAGGNLASFEDVVFRDNTATDGGALAAPGSTVELINTVFEGNSATNGGALFATQSAVLGISGSTFVGNTAARGGGIYQIDSVTTTMSDTELSNNSVTNIGGGIFLSGGTLTGTNITFGDNTPEDAHADVGANFPTTAVNLSCDSSGGCVTQ